MTDHFPDDCRDLNAPENFINRSPKERSEAALYFLRAGAVEPLRVRMAMIRQVEPDFILNLQGVDLTNACLWQASLPRINFRAARLAWADLSGADLRYCDCSGASFMGADLRHADLTCVNFSGADLRGADLTGARTDGADMTGVLTGDLTDEQRRDDPNYRRVQAQRVAKAEREARIAMQMDGLTTSYTAPKRDYSVGGGGGSGSGVDPKAAAKQAAQDAMNERKAQKKADQKKWNDKKRAEKRFVAKKAADNKVFQDKKRRDEEAFRRKQDESKRR